MKAEPLLFEIAAMTPLMEQYYTMKSKHPDALLLYRVGDFYETFGEDAKITSTVLGIVLTKRNNGGSDIELAGFPYHALDAYLPKLVRAGYRVALCEQLEKPSKGKKIVKRGITDVITPGITTDEKLLDVRKNNFLAAIHFSPEKIGVAFADISTGEFLVSEGHPEYIQKLLLSFNPSEIILSKARQQDFERLFGDQFYTYPLEEWIFREEYTNDKLLHHFKVNSLKGFGLDAYREGPIAAGVVLHYLESVETKNPAQLSSLTRLSNDDFVWMDRFTIRNLELIDPIHPEGQTLLSIIDHTKTPMGSRLLRKWIVLPLVALDKIHERLSMVESLCANSTLLTELNNLLHQFGDLERLVSKIPMRRISPREVNHIAKCLNILLPLKNVLLSQDNPALHNVGRSIQECLELHELITLQLSEDAPNQTNKGGIFRSGFSSELDELKYLLTNSKDLLIEIQKKEAIQTGIQTLKVGYNSVFGYYLEVTNKFKNQGLVPVHWIRKQTTSTGERYVTEELKSLESRILGAEERIIQLEEELYDKLVDKLQDYLSPLQQNAQMIAHIDVIHAFARCAILNSFCKPLMDDSKIIDIKEGRHPVIEKQLPVGESYIPNDIYLDSDDQQILMITGPNMSGKSAILRQTALICLLAQIGSFVPAKEARLGLIDRIFTRVGASDNISSGESTFMVEMNETSSILNNISDRSLILLDEIGRGTSTYDGISIAWAIAEYLHGLKDKRAKTLFATHYHELNELSSYLERIHNFHVATQEINNKVIFLRKLLKGGSEHSFGIHVAEMAGMPKSVITRANEILRSLEEKRSDSNASVHRQTLDMSSQKHSNDERLHWANEKLNKIQNIDLQTITPIEAMIALVELQKEITRYNS